MEMGFRECESCFCIGAIGVLGIWDGILSVWRAFTRMWHG